MNSFSRLLASGTLAIAAGLTPGAASAAPVTFDFTADIFAVAFDLVGAGFSSNTLSGSYTFDDATADADGSAGTGSYLGALSALSFSDIGANNTGTATNGDITVLDGATDSYRVFSDTGDGLTGVTNAVGYSLDSFTLNLADNSGTGFGDDSLPSTPPALGDFPDIQSIRLGFRFDAFTVNEAIYTITSLTLVSTGPGPGPLPEPGTIVLSVAGLAGLGAIRRRSPSS